MPDTPPASAAHTPPTRDRELDALRQAPHSIEAEQSVLGGLLLENTAWERIADLVSAGDFYSADHRTIWTHLTRLLEDNKPADVITLAESLERSGELAKVGGLGYLSALANNVPTAANIRRYAEIVRERSLMRELARVGTEIADSAYTPSGRAAKVLLDEAEAKVLAIAEQGKRGGQGFLDLGTLVAQVVDRIDQLHNSPVGDVTGIASGFTDLDRDTSGLQPGDLVIVAGRPSMGKTALALNMAEHVALVERMPVVVFSMEMSGAQLVLRMLGSTGRIDQQRLRTGRLEDTDWPRLTSAISSLTQAQLLIDETPALNALELRSRARRAARSFGGRLGLIVIDYLQLMSASSTGENRATEISEISRSLKALAKELQVPVVALSQLNRSLEQRPNKRPVMSDLRESGAIEQDADVILFIYRDEVYNPESPDKGVAELIIGKQRNGPIGTVRLTFLGRHTKFENFANTPGRF
ncbi:MAG: replicative DNA helicase [Pseudomonadota bacterium]|jgi:replicative DNA helicase